MPGSFMNQNYVDYYQNLYKSWLNYTQNCNMLFFQYNASLAESISNAFDENKASFVSLASNEIRTKMRKSFDTSFREKMKDEGFIDLVSKTLDSWMALSEFFGINKSYQILVDLFSSMNKTLEPLRDSLNRTDSEIIQMNGRYHLLHYKSNKKPSYKLQY